MAVKISAIVSAYYAEKYIEKRLLNLQEQTLPPEIVVVCRDGSFEQKISEEARAIVVPTEDIPPLSVAWNLGIKAARGRYVTTANSDDMLYKTGLDQLVKCAETSGAAVCFSDVDLQQGDKLPTQWRRVIEKRGVIENAYQKIYKRCIVGPMPIWRRDLHKKHGYFDEQLSIVCDWDLWLRLAQAGEMFYYHPQPVGIYLMRNDSLERRDKNRLSTERNIVRDKWRA
jgi:GT2 family glycosyltransferase